jgi:hypothetical protein
MADVQLQPQQDAVQAGAAVRAGDSRAVWILLALFALAVAVAATMVVLALTNDEQPATRTVTRTVVVPVDTAAAQAMKDESKAAASVGAAISGVDAAPTTEEAKTEAALHAISVRSIGLQQMLDNTDLAERLNEAANASSGVNAKDEAGVAAAIGNGSD